MRKRLLSALCILGMMLTLLPGTALADDSTVLPEDEYERAVRYGFAEKRSNPDVPTTESEFVKMLSAMIRTYKPERLGEFEQLSYVREADNSRVFRFYAAILLLYAAEAIDCAPPQNARHANIPNDLEESGAWDWSEFWYTDWDATDGWTEETFSEISAAMTKYRGEPMSHYDGGIEFAISCLSCVNGQPLLDFDATNYMRQNDCLTYREGAVAVLRLFESVWENAALSIDFSDANKWEDNFLRAAEERKQSILTNQDSLPCKGTAYYISNSGSDANDGKSPETAWNSLSKINTYNFKAGDVIYLERGGLWRGEVLVLKEGVSLSAYGEGEKPKIYGSTDNGAVSENWSLFYQDETGKKIWAYQKKLTECGGIMLGDTDTIARKIFAWYDGKNFYDALDRTKLFSIKDALKQDLTFYCDSKPKQTGLPANTGMPILAEFTVYLRCDAGNPGEIYDSIEFINQVASDRWDANINAAENCIIDNLCLMFCCTGVEVLTGNVTIQNCEIAYAGGFPIEYIEPVNNGCIWVQGEGIFLAGSGVVIQDNYIHDIYGWGINFEVCRPYEQTVPYLPFSDTVIQGNLIDNCSGSMGVTANLEETRNRTVFDSIKIQDNWMMNTGYGWWYDDSLSKIVPAVNSKQEYNSLTIGGIGEHGNGESTIWISDNVIYRARSFLACTNTDNEFPAFVNNVFAQTFGGAVLLKQDEEVATKSSEATEQALHEKYGKDAGKVVALRPDFEIGKAPAASTQLSSVTATPTASTVLVNGKQETFDAYTIGGDNYFKLRDLAYVLNGTGKQFDVSWDGAANAISLISGQSYTSVGGEMIAGTAGAKPAAPTSSRILVDGKEVSLVAYTIGGSNYFKLRDIGQIFDFGIGWDGTNGTITIDTSIGYIA